jgi:hypothetical protein
MEHKGKSVLVVGHSNTVPGIIAALGGPKLPDICDASYAILFTLRIPAAGEPTLTRASYGVADKVEEAACQGMTAR